MTFTHKRNFSWKTTFTDKRNVGWKTTFTDKRNVGQWKKSLQIIHDSSKTT